MAYPDNNSPYTGLPSSTVGSPLLALLTGGFKGFEQGQQTAYQRQIAQANLLRQQNVAQNLMEHRDNQDANSNARTQLQGMRVAAYTGSIAARDKAGAQRGIMSAYQAGDDPSIIAGMQQNYKNTFGEDFLPAPPSPPLGATSDTPPVPTGLAVPAPKTLMNQSKIANDAARTNSLVAKNAASTAHMNATDAEKFATDTIPLQTNAATQPLPFQTNFEQGRNAEAVSRGLPRPYLNVAGLVPDGQAPIAGPPTPAMVQQSPAYLGAPLNINPPISLTPAQIAAKAAANLSNVTAGIKPDAQATTDANVSSEIRNRDVSQALNARAQNFREKQAAITNQIAQGHLDLANRRFVFDQQTRQATQSGKLDPTVLQYLQGQNHQLDAISRDSLQAQGELARAQQDMLKTGNTDASGNPIASIQARITNAQTRLTGNQQKQAQIQSGLDAYWDKHKPAGFTPSPTPPAPPSGSMPPQTGGAGGAGGMMGLPAATLGPIGSLPALPTSSGSVSGGSVTLPNGRSVPIMGRATPSPRPAGGPPNNATTPPRVTMRTPQAPAPSQSGARLSRAQIDAMTPAQKLAHLSKILSGKK